MTNNNIGAVLGNIGCKFRSNIENHIKDYKLQKGDDVEWLLEPLDELSYPKDYVLDAFISSSHWFFYYNLYFHLRKATDIYIPYNEHIDWYENMRLAKQEGENIPFLYIDDIEELSKLKPKPFNKSMLIKGALDFCVAQTIPEIWDELIVPFTTVGIWQAVLLHKTKTFLPKGWHACYMRSYYVYSMDDMQTIIKKHKKKSYNFDHEKLATYLNRDDIMPSVEIDGDKATASYYYWNDWSGFCRRIIPIEKQGHSIKFGEFERETHVKYNCGIKY